MQPSGSPQAQPGVQAPEGCQCHPLAQEGQSHTHNDGAVSRATVQLVPATTPGHTAGSPRVPARPTPTPEQAQLLREARLDWPLEQGARGGSQGTGETREMLFVHFSRAKRQDVPLMNNLAHAGQRMGIGRAGSGAPGLSPRSPEPGVPSPLTPGCREPAQFHHDPPGSFGTCTWYRYPTPDRKHRAEAAARARWQHPEQDTGWLSPVLAVTWALPVVPWALPAVPRALPVTWALPAVPWAWRAGQQREWSAEGQAGANETRASSRNQLFQLCLLSPGQHNSLRHRSSSQAPPLTLPTPCQGTAQPPLPLERLLP